MVADPGRPLALHYLVYMDVRQELSRFYFDN